MRPARLRAALLGAMALFGMLLAPAAPAVNHALLVGVSQYPSLPQKDWLVGPANDVRLMRRVLQTRGFDDARIRVLADGVAGAALPTRDAIVGALQGLARQVGDGDFVYLHFAGHGARQPQGAADTDVEPDGLDEIFLPRDIGRWDRDIQQVAQAITDDDFDRYISAIRRRGAFVWAVFDSCHSGTMMRGAPAPAVRYRRVDESELGIPPAAMAGHGAGGDAGEQVTPPPAALRGGFVAFYAAQTDEQAPELQLPLRGTRRDWHGLLSYSVAEVLANPQSMSYRQAAERILQRYGATNLRSPTPLFEGSGLDAVLLGQTSLASTPQWPLQVRRKGIRIPAGELAQLGEGSVLAVLARPQDRTDQALGYLQVVSAGPFEAQLEPLAFNGTPAPEARALPRDGWARLVSRRSELGLTVALPPHGAHLTAAQAKALAAVQQLAGEPAAGGIPVRWVAAGEVADLRLGFSPQEVADCPADRLWLLPAGGELHCRGAGQTHAIRLDRDAAQLRHVLTDSLQRIGKVLNLERIAAQLAVSGPATGVELVVEISPRDGGPGYRLTAERIGRLRAGDRMRARAVNHGRRPVDLTVLVIDGSYGVHAFYPRGGASNRVEAGGAVALFDTRVNADTVGLEQLLAIAAPARPRSPQTDYRFLAQATLAGTRGGGDSLSGLLRQAGFGVSQRGRAGMAGGDMQLVRWRVSE